MLNQIKQTNSTEISHTRVIIMQNKYKIKCFYTAFHLLNYFALTV